MKNLIVNSRNYWLPESVDEVIQLVNQAKQNKQKIAVRGAAHSFPLVKTNEQDSSYLFMMLTYLDKILSFDKTKGIVTVQAGCHLGLDPFDPTGVSTLENSLLYQLDPFDLKTGKRTQAPGWALPDLGGITHQTVGGFMATGSSGGATKYSFEDSILSVDIVHADENGAKVSTFSRPSDDSDDPFFGVAFVNLGLMGIIVSVTFQCIPSFNISGNELTTFYDGCEIDLFGEGSKGKLSLEQFLQKPKYTRLMWWPQTTAQKMVVWQADRVDAFNDWQDFKSVPYKEVPFIFGSPDLAELAADAIFTFVGNWPKWLEHLFGNGEKTKEEIEKFAKKLNPYLIKLILKIFEPVSEKDPKPQEFTDIWWNGLPMDNQMSDKLFPVWFTELWIPLNLSQKVMNDLKIFYENTDHAGAFSCEIYAAGKNKFWLSPAYDTDVIRIDIFWFGHNPGNPSDYYQYFWKELAQYNFRPHWGKYLPAPDGEQGVEYLKSVYPDTWQKWMELRKQMDPDNIFLTNYWAQHLNLEN
ncbi:MAG: FAD-binding protein [Saprospiraceae bacterium]|nr:FAD-binding protein [Saprospiraceae bacterium]